MICRGKQAEMRAARQALRHTRVARRLARRLLGPKRFAPAQM